MHSSLRRVWRYQRGNPNPYIEEEQTTQWPKDNVQKDKQRTTKNKYKTKDQVTRTPLKTGGELRKGKSLDRTCYDIALFVHLYVRPSVQHNHVGWFFYYAVSNVFIHYEIVRNGDVMVWLLLAIIITVVQD